jgi:hypothetical protein
MVKIYLNHEEKGENDIVISSQRDFVLFSPTFSYDFQLRRRTKRFVVSAPASKPDQARCLRLVFAAVIEFFIIRLCV